MTREQLTALDDLASTLRQWVRKQNRDAVTPREVRDLELIDSVAVNLAFYVLMKRQATTC